MKSVRWYIRFISLKGTQYRIDIYDEGTFEPVELYGGPTPFTTEENSSDDYFTPIRTQTGTIEICTLLPGTTDQYITLEELLPASNTSRMVKLVNVEGNVVEWLGFLSCESYSQDYTSIPQIIQLPVISLLEALRSVGLDSSFFQDTDGDTIGGFIYDIFDRQIYDTFDLQIGLVYTDNSNILNKYLFVSQFFSYETNEASGSLTYLYTSTSIHDILERICKIAGWCLRERGTTLYFTRLGENVNGMTEVDMSSLVWRGTDHQRTIMQGAKMVSVEAEVTEFETYFNMPFCPILGLVQKNYYDGVLATPRWYYDKCTQTSLPGFSTSNINNAFLARFYGIRNDSSMPWNTIYEDIGFNNVIYLVGHAFSDTSYNRYCTIPSALEFSCICGVTGTLEEVGFFILKIKDEVATKLEVDGYIRCGLKFAGRYYSGITGTLWNNNPASSFKVELSHGSGELRIPIPKISNNIYTFAKSRIELYFYNDFNNTQTSALISEVSIEYEPPFSKYKDPQKTNRYMINLFNEFRDEIRVQLELASDFANVNGLSHLYTLNRYTYGQEYVDYIEPITTLTYDNGDGTTEERRPEVDLLNRLANYYSNARQRISIIVEHPTVAPLPIIMLNGINPDSRKYAPLSESRDWKADTCTITCFETENNE